MRRFIPGAALLIGVAGFAVYRWFGDAWLTIAISVVLTTLAMVFVRD
ncbi:MAG: hypothetical protein JO041_09405 [Acidobacteria bacterium]|nr:hypothetical protein [Acidobacteriota bacterium]